MFVLKGRVALHSIYRAAYQTTRTVVFHGQRSGFYLRNGNECDKLSHHIACEIAWAYVDEVSSISAMLVSGKLIELEGYFRDRYGMGQYGEYLDVAMGTIRETSRTAIDGSFQDPVSIQGPLQGLPIFLRFDHSEMNSIEFILDEIQDWIDIEYVIERSREHLEQPTEYEKTIAELGGLGMLCEETNDLPEDDPYFFLKRESSKIKSPALLYDRISGYKNEKLVAKEIIRLHKEAKFQTKAEAKCLLDREIGANSFLRAWSIAREQFPQIGRPGKRTYLPDS